MEFKQTLSIQNSCNEERDTTFLPFCGNNFRQTMCVCVLTERILVPETNVTKKEDILFFLKGCSCFFSGKLYLNPIYSQMFHFGTHGLKCS